MADVLQFPLPVQSCLVFEPGDAPGTLEHSDGEARAAALDIHRSWIVEAPAGSGKTGLLIQRFLKLLAFGGVDRPREVLAITFTRKAAAELRTRVLQQLAAAAGDEALPGDAGSYERITRDLARAVLDRDQALGWHLLASPNQLNIRTIDSFCAELAGSLPLLSGGTGRRRPVEDASLLYETAAERALRELGGTDASLTEALRRVLLHRDAQLSDCIRLIASMLGEREQWGELVPLGQHDLTEEVLDGLVRQRLEDTLERVVCKGLSEAANRVGPDLLGELSRIAAHLSAAPGYNGGFSPIAQCNGRAHAPGNTGEHLHHWLALISLLLKKDGEWRRKLTKDTLEFELPKQDKPWLEELILRLSDLDDREPGLRKALCAVRCLPPARYPDDQWRVVKALFRVLRRALAELQLIFAEQGLCDFTEIALTARSLLRAEPDLLNRADTQLTHLLVDEMQDTSARQYDLLELLTRSWDGATQTLFLVGDPKQSIYAFRQARVERFMRTQASGRLADVPLAALRLTANFRSQAELVHEFNQTFELILPPPPGEYAPENPVQSEVPFVAATPTRAPGATPAVVWHGRLAAAEQPTALEAGEPEEEPADPTADIEARAMRRTIEEFRERWKLRADDRSEGKREPKIAVLARSRTHLAPVIEEFYRDRGLGRLPFRAVDIEVLSERPEVLDVLALTRALLHPGDRIAWLAVLHSPVCGLGRADLLALTGEGAEAEPEATVAHLVTSRRHHLSAEGQGLLARAWYVLAAAQDSSGRTALSTQVERTWRTLGADALLLPEQSTNVRRFFQLLQRLEAGTQPLSLALLERGLQKLYAEPFAAPAAVELMTIHKAKGLEWDLVLVPALERSTGRTQHALLKWVELDREKGEETDVILAPVQGKGEESSALSKWVSSLERQREAAEAKRLFYVACTRAREELHLFAACKFKKSGELAAPPPDSLLSASWPAAEPVLSHQLAAHAPPGERLSPIEAPPMRFDSRPQQPLALAAAADDGAPHQRAASNELAVPLLERLPAGFDPLARFRRENGPQLPYPPAAALRHTLFDRPEGSFAARAFGNAVHRFLDLIAQKLAAGKTVEHLLAEMPSWHARLVTTFRAEGISPSLSAREAGRAARALEATLRDPIGHWLLAPHPGARSERAVQVGGAASSSGLVRSLRADRTFLAGARPLATETNGTLWIIDFKTAEAGGRPVPSFLESERTKYEAQLNAYAEACAAAGDPAQPIMLALFYPLLTHLLYWPYQPVPASQ